MWQTAGVVVILAVVLVYVARQVIRMVRSKTPACCGCIGCSGLEETPGPREGCERP
ncbi:MAG: FeoB-associated Cys-rich membrane protein [Syntrophobacteraceae bacterium]|nr:FeoB-associated Cys-rich membrane protein [Syntrophobacteraceae bacterium]